MVRCDLLHFLLPEGLNYTCTYMYVCNMNVSTYAAHLCSVELPRFVSPLACVDGSPTHVRRLLCCHCVKLLVGMYNKNVKYNVCMIICCSNVIDTEYQQPENPLSNHRREEAKVSCVQSKKMGGRSTPNLNGWRRYRVRNESAPNHRNHTAKR